MVVYLSLSDTNAVIPEVQMGESSNKSKPTIQTESAFSLVLSLHAYVKRGSYILAE